MNLLTQDIANCCRCYKPYSIDQIPDSGACPQCDLDEEVKLARLENEMSDSELIFGREFDPKKVKIAISEPDEPETETPPMMTAAIAELIGYSPIDPMEKFYDFVSLNDIGREEVSGRKWMDAQDQKAEMKHD